MEKYIFTTVWILIILAFIGIFFIFVIKPIIEKEQDIKNKQAKNQLYGLFMQMDPKACETYVVNRIKEYINEYVVYNITGKNKSYINKDDTTDMIKTVAKNTYANLPELYIFYISMITNIEDSDSLLKYIHRETSKQVLLYITEFNKPQ